MSSLTQFLESSGEDFKTLLQDHYSFEVIDEDKIEWSLFNEMHAILNRTYAHRSKAFFSKAFAHRPPLKRVLCKHKGKLVGISAYFEDYVEIDKQRVLIGGEGLTCPRYGIGDKLRYIITRWVAAQCGVPFCIGRVSNVGKRTLSPYVHAFLNVPLIGKETKSHSWESIAIYKTSNSDLEIQTKYVDYFNKHGFIRIEGEIF